jgi:hypothetical protein
MSASVMGSRDRIRAPHHSLNCTGAAGWTGSCYPLRLRRVDTELFGAEPYATPHRLIAQIPVQLGGLDPVMHRSGLETA